MKKIPFIVIAMLVVNVTLAQWVQINSGTKNNLYSVMFPDSTIGYAVGDSGLILKTVDGGLSWFKLNSGTSNWLRSVYFSDVNTGFAVGKQGTILKTTNGGAIWTSLVSENSVSLYSVYFVNNDTGYAVGGGNPNIIMKTTDGGLTWSYQTLPYGYNVIFLTSVFFTSPDTGYITSGNDLFQLMFAVIFKTINGGNTWFQIYYEYTMAHLIGLNSINFKDANTGYAVGGTFQILKSTKVDTIWISQANESKQYLSSISFIPTANGPNIAYAVGDWGTILKNYNGDSTWTSEVSGTSKHLYSITFNNAERGFIVGQDGVILMNSNCSGIDDKEIHPNSKIIKIYPNPTSNIINIESSEHMTSGYISIYNLYGQEVIHQMEYTHTTQIDVGLLAIGTYFVKVTREKEILFGKFLKK